METAFKRINNMFLLLVYRQDANLLHQIDGDCHSFLVWLADKPRPWPLMTQIEEQILENLKALETAAAQMATANPKPNLKPIFSRLDELTRQLPRGTEPDLLHYLHRKSYQKARAFLEARQGGAV